MGHDPVDTKANAKIPFFLFRGEQRGRVDSGRDGAAFGGVDREAIGTLVKIQEASDDADLMIAFPETRNIICIKQDTWIGLGFKRSSKGAGKGIDGKIEEKRR